MRFLLSACVLLLAGCAATGPEVAGPDKPPISCPATCKTTYTQCTSGCIGSNTTGAADCAITCDRVIEECFKTCETPPKVE